MKRLFPITFGVLAACGRDATVVCLTDGGDTFVAETVAETTTQAVDTVPEKDTTVAAVDTSEPEITAPVCQWEAWDEGLTGGRVDMVAFDPRATGVVWAASGRSLLRSTDGGETWLVRSEDVTPSNLAFPPDDPKQLLAGSGDGLWASDDTGRNFAEKALGGLHVRALLTHPASPQRVFIGTSGGGILRSDNGGDSFAPANVGVPRMFVEGLAAPGDDPNVVLAAGLLQSASYGPENSGVILRSVDGGLTWTTVASGADVVWGHDISVCPSDPARVLAAVRKGVLASRDGGLTWDRVAVLGTRDAISVDWAAGTCDSWWVAVYQQGVFRVDDDGLTLTGPAVDGFDFEIARFAGALAAHPDDPAILLVATHAGLYRSVDGGFHWRAIDAAKGVSVFDLEAGGDRLWMATWGNGVWSRTADEAWAKDGSVGRDHVLSIIPDPSAPERVIAGSHDAWFTSAGPGGFATVPGLPNTLDAIALGEPAELLIATQVAGVLRTADPHAGATASNQGLTPFATPNGTFIDARAMVVDPVVAGRVYVGLRGEGVAISADRGASWQQPDNALRHEQVMRLAAHHDAASGTTRIFAAAVGRGVWVSSDGGLTWDGDSEDFESLDVADLAVDPVTGRVYVSEAGGPIRWSEDGLTWAALARHCLPVEGWGQLAVIELAGARWLVATGSGNRVIRHPL